VGAVLVALGVAGFPAGDGGFLGLQCSTAMNCFDIAAGALLLLAAAGTVEEPEPPQGSFLRGA
jgi:hypothetical protein